MNQLKNNITSIVCDKIQELSENETLTPDQKKLMVDLIMDLHKQALNAVEDHNSQLAKATEAAFNLANTIALLK